MRVGLGSEGRPYVRSLRKSQKWATKLVYLMLFLGDLSSISGSEDSNSAREEDLEILDEEKAGFEKPNRPRGFHSQRVLFQNAQGQFLYAYRCVLGPCKASGFTGCVVNTSLLYIQLRFPLSLVCFSLLPFLPIGYGYHACLIAQSWIEVA